MSIEPDSDRMRILKYFSFSIDPVTMGQDKDGNPNHQELFMNTSYWLSNDKSLNNMVSEGSMAFKDEEDNYTFYVNMNRDNLYKLHLWLRKVFEKEGMSTPYAGTFRLKSHEVLEK